MVAAVRPLQVAVAVRRPQVAAVRPLRVVVLPHPQAVVLSKMRNNAPRHKKSTVSHGAILVYLLLYYIPYLYIYMELPSVMIVWGGAKN